MSPPNPTDMTREGLLQLAAVLKRIKMEVEWHEKEADAIKKPHFSLIANSDMRCLISLAELGLKHKEMKEKK